jgi:hypothetical protein
VVPLQFYERFRDPLRHHEMQAVGDLEAQAHDTGDFDEAATIKLYQQLITELPPLSRQLLLYILDLLAVFASKSDLNRMSATNLAAIFQPGMLSHPTHDMSPGEYRLSQDVVVFLIEKQDHFLIGMSGTAADDETVKEVQSGGTPQATTPTTGMHARPAVTGLGLGRSSSTASAGADSMRRYGGGGGGGGGLRKNLSISSKHSKHSVHVPSPSSPNAASPTATGGGVHRSNTVPSKKSPAVPSGRFQKLTEATPSPTSSPTAAQTTASRHSPKLFARSSQPSSPLPGMEASGRGPEDSTNDDDAATTGTAPASGSNPQDPSTVCPPSTTPGRGEPSAPNTGLGVVTTITAGDVQSISPKHDNTPKYLDAAAPNVRQSTSNPVSTPTKERNHLSSFFSRSPTSDTERKDSRAPNKLRKKQRVPGSGNVSAQSSSGSLHDDLG